MAEADLYDTDILAWSERQAEALRELATRHDLPNTLDLAHVVEEIEDVGQSEMRAAKSFIRLILEHVVKGAFLPNSPRLEHWRDEIGAWQDQLADRLTAGMCRRLDLDALWKQAIRRAIPKVLAQAQVQVQVQVQSEMDKLRLSLAALKDFYIPCPVSFSDLTNTRAEPVHPIAHVASSYLKSR